MMTHKLFKVIAFEMDEAYKIRVFFDDGSKQFIDFEAVLLGPRYAPLRDLAIFNQVKIDPIAKTLVWPNGADFDPETLRNWEKYESLLVDRLKMLEPAGL